ncbi:MAG: hypothetical protein IJW32_01990 [Clostridia bacterium]|nr:hypothetical protein [Clostridia bacterium]
MVNLNTNSLQYIQQLENKIYLLKKLLSDTIINANSEIFKEQMKNKLLSKELLKAKQENALLKLNLNKNLYFK